MTFFVAVLMPAFGFASNRNGSADSTATSKKGGGIPGCFSTGATNTITLSNIPSRYTGVAPLSVFFDASDTIANATTRPFHDLEYRWDFGDPAGSLINGVTWNAGSRAGVSSRNVAIGPEAAHVFETPGVYTVTLTATDSKNTATNNCTRIVVQDPGSVFSGSNTICVSSNTTPTAGANGCPSGALTVMQSSFPTAVNTYALTGKRVLFKRGDTFAAATSALINRTGPGILGAYGAGAMPKVQMTGNTDILMLSSRATPGIKDWRIMDLEFDGMSKTRSVAVNTDGGINQVTILNMNMHDVANGAVFNDSIIQWWHLKEGLTAHTMFDEIAIVDSIITPIFNSTSGWRIFASANRGSIQGNILGNMVNDSSMGSHVLRVPHMAKGVIANNTLARAGVSQHALKLHAQGWCESTSPAGTCVTYDNVTPPPSYTYLANTHPIGIFTTLSGYTEKVIIADNKIIGADNPHSMTVSSQNRQMDERLRDIIVERNWFTSGKGTQLSLLVVSSAITVRNNIFDMTAGKYKTFVKLASPGTSPPSADVNVYNNTLYGGSAPVIAGNEFVGISIDPTATKVAVVNNLISAPSATNPVRIVGTGAGIVSSNNSTAIQIKTTPGWVATFPSTPSDFNLTAKSYAIGAGISVPVFSDFFLNSRPIYHLGATGQ